MATATALFTVHAYIALTAAGTLVFWTLAHRAYRRDTAARPVATVHELRRAA
jgi:hypothetical protein